MSSPLLYLPVEVQDAIFERVSRTDLASIRLVCKAINNSPTKLLFSRMILTGDYRSASQLLAVMGSAELSSYVRTLAIERLELDANMIWFGENISMQTLMPENFLPCLDALPQLANLSTLSVAFESIAPARANWEGMRIEKFDEYQIELFEKVFQVLVRWSPKSLRSLSFANLPGSSQQTQVMRHPGFASLLGNVQDLNFCMSPPHMESDDDYGFRLLYQSYVKFFPPLPRLWLASSASNLTTLKLAVKGQYWGYHPRCDLRQIWLPRIRNLCLESYIFSHDWQLHWLAGLHTLRNLSFEDCSILIYAILCNGIDHEGYPLDINRDDFQGVENHFYKTRWSTYLDTLTSALQELEAFQLCFHSEESGDDIRWKCKQDCDQFCCNRYVKLHWNLWFSISHDNYIHEEATMPGDDDQKRDSDALHRLQDVVTKRKMRRLGYGKDAEESSFE